jgi:hypothetical protein
LSRSSRCTLNAKTCLSDIARFKHEHAIDDLIWNWLRNRNTLKFLGIREQLNNPGFNPVEFDGIKSQAGLNSFTLTPKQWIERTGAIGITSKAGRYGGTFAHKDIAFEFASWISVEFKLYHIKEFQRLKVQEQKTLGWDIRRNLAKINYRIHTDAIQTHLIRQQLTKSQAALIYASEVAIHPLICFRLVSLTSDHTKMNWPGSCRRSFHEDSDEFGMSRVRHHLH